MSNITIQNFERHISAKILARGREIWKNGLIYNLDEETDGEWMATVQGSGGNEYEVYIGLDGENLDHWECSCPFDVDHFCKHQAAVLYQLRQERFMAARPAREESAPNKYLSRTEILAKVRALRMERAREIAAQHRQPGQAATPAADASRVTSGRTVEQLFQEYERLNGTDKRLVKIAAAAWEPVSQTKLTEVFNACSFKNNGIGLYPKDMAPLLSVLMAKGFLLPNAHQYQCDRAFAESLCDRDFTHDTDFPHIAKVIRKEMPLAWYTGASGPDRLFREMRIARYLDHAGEFSHYFHELAGKQNSGYTRDTLLDYWLPPVFDLPKIKRLPENVQTFLLQEKLSRETFYLTAPDGYFHYATEQLRHFNNAGRANLARIASQLLLFRGDWEGMQRLFDLVNNVDAAALAGIQHLISGNTQESISCFQRAQKQLRQDTKSTKNVLSHLAGLFHIMAMMKTQDAALYPKIDAHIEQVFKTGTNYLQGFVYLRATLSYLQNNKSAALRTLKAQTSEHLPLLHFFRHLCTFWVDGNSIDRAQLAEYRQHLEYHGYAWLAAEVLALQAELDPTLGPESERRNAELRIEPLCRLLPRVEEWETALSLLTAIAASKNAAARENDTRLVWFVDFEHKRLEPKEQSFGKKGWTQGRSIPDYRLRSADLPCMTEQDKRIAQVFQYSSYYHLDKSISVWKALVGHPLLFLSHSPDVAVQLLDDQPVLVAQKTKGGYQLRFSHAFDQEGFQIVKETPTRYKLIVISAEQARIAQSFNGRALFVPEKGAERLGAILEGLGKSIPVQSVFEEERLPATPADPRICVHLLPVGNGFHVELYVKPFTDAPPYLKPGRDEATVVAVVGGQKVRAERALKQEIQNAEKVMEQVPILRHTAPKHGVWEIEDAQQCLELLAQMHPLVQSGEILLEWPKGEKMRVRAVAGFDQFKMRISSGQNWFEVNGELQVDENRVLTLQELLVMSASGQQFVEISPGQFIALTNEFRRRLRQIDGLLSTRKNGSLQLHPLAAGALEVFTQQVQHADFDQKFRENREQIQAAFAKKYKVPGNFNAQLRPYQREGFEWLSRCAAAGFGACLADDMGLGKTVQALSFLSTRANLGPALVVAPASVCRNWVVETQKFAPALRPVLFGEGDRIAVVENAGKGVLLIVTYDLLARSSEHFVQKRFATVLLDEAQFIKNRATKRSDTAMRLQGDFRFIMTGTPLENHLGELWNLFQFANPGLLGSPEDFNERFALPIEKNRDEERREQLRRLVQPFILRRRKDEVLRELPAKTEITLSVPLSPEERAFYEALRRNALETLSAGADNHAGEKHLRILAEIMRLRRAACHPNLADAGAGFKSSAKLELFGQIVDELLENGHKALVFSQFVGHLEILETYLKKKKIAYQYLDGQTPLATRQKRIEAFQSGEGDLFLISLRAGGTGLNLTAADYVIHTDPWWNPAVEDQATDRAHRIGQEKPVTVYRLVAEQTIEEKILQLHAHKRDLADSLLAGADVSAKLTADELMALIAAG